MTDETVIIKAVLDGDQDAYAALVRQYSPRVLSLCHSMLGSKNAEDAAQEVFLKIYFSLKNFKGNSSFSTWLYRIAYNHCLDTIRKESRQKSESWDALIENHDEEINRLITEGQDPQKQLRTQELVHQVLSLLSEDYRTVITLRELNGFSYQEIAEITHSSLDSVKARLRRAREDFEQKMRHFLKKDNV